MLIEVLVTMFVVAVGLLGAAGMQLATTKYQQTATAKIEALEQADFIIEKIRVNSSILTLANLGAATANPDGGYLAADDYDNATDLPADPNCGLSGQPICNAAQSAQRDLREWRQSLARTLPGGRGSLFPVGVGAATEANGRRVVVMWREKAQLETDTAANLGVDLTDAGCPPPLVDGIRCLNLWVTP
jgi:type IV pilus assembly protein PilV